MVNTKIAELRKQRGIKQVDLAKMLGISQGNLSNWETGNYEPDFQTAIKLADYFGVSVDYLLGREEESKIPPASLEQTGLDGIYFHLAKEAQNMKLPEKDIEAVLEFAKYLNSKNKE